MEIATHRDFNLESTVSKIALGASRWMDKERPDILSVITRFNEYKTALGNPTKNINESVDVIYEALDKLNCFVIGGEEEGAVDKIQQVLERVSKKLPQSVDPGLASRQIAEIRQKSKEEIGGKNLALVFSNDMGKVIVMELPKQYVK